MKRMGIATLLMCVISLGLFATGTAESAKVEKPVTITFWHHEAPAHRVAAFQAAADLFMKENPDIKVNQEVVMWGDAWVKSLTAVEAKTLPDFQFSLPDMTMTMYNANALVPVTDLVKEVDAQYKYFPQIRDMYQYKGEYWGLPVFTMVMVLTYRPSLMKEFAGTTEAPKTWKDVIEYSKKIKANSKGEVSGIALAGGKNLLVDEQAYIFMAGSGSRFFDKNGKVTFNNPRTVEALKMYKELIQYAPEGAEAWSWGEMELNIAADTCAMHPYFPSVQKRFDEEFNSDDYAAWPMPLFDANSKSKGTITYPNDIHLYKTTTGDRLEASKKFIKFLMQPAVNAVITSGAEAGAFFPCTEAARNAPEYWNHPTVKRFKPLHDVAFEALSYANLYGFENGWVNLGMGDISGADILAEVINKVVTGQMTPEEGAAWGQAQMEKYSKPIK